MSSPIPSPPPLGPIRQRLEAVEGRIPPAGVWEALPSPIVIAHRGNGNRTAPENTLPAFRWAASLGFIVEADLQYTADGGIICHHDTTLDRATGTAHGWRASEFSLDGIRRLDFSHSLLPQIFGPLPPPTFEEYMDLARTGALLAPEVRGSTGEMGADVARRIVRAGLQESFLVQAFSAEELVAVKSVDPSIRTMRLGTPLVEEAIENGYWAVSPERKAWIERPDRDAWTAAMQAAGVRVIPYVANEMATAEEAIALGADGYFTDTPAITSRPGYRIPTGGPFTIPVPPVYDFAAWPWSSQVPGAYPVVEDGYATLAGYTDWSDGDSTKIEVAGVRTADSPATQTIETTLKVTAPNPSGSVSRYIAFRWAWSPEGSGASTVGTGGYQFAYLLDGRATLRRFEPASILLESGSFPAISPGEEIPIRIEMTSTSITVTRTDTGHSITTEDATLPRGGFMHVFSGGLIPAIGDVTVTY